MNSGPNLQGDLKSSQEEKSAQKSNVAFIVYRQRTRRWEWMKNQQKIIVKSTLYDGTANPVEAML